MRNAVIRRKQLEEAKLIRQYMYFPQKFVLGADADDIDWAKSDAQRQIFVLK